MSWFRYSIALLVLAGSAVPFGHAQAAAECGIENPNAVLFEQAFDSGAAWALCVQMHDQTGLGVTDVHYTAPGGTSRKVLDSASIAQILFKYDEDTEAEPWLSRYGLGGSNQMQNNSNLCADGEQVVNGPSEPQFCVHRRDLNNLTSVRRTEALRRNAFSLHAWSEVNAYVIEQVWEFTEDGQLFPMMRLGGVLHRFSTNPSYSTDVGLEERASNANYLTTWKLDFNINDTPNNDIVESVEFIPHQTTGLRRLIETNELTTESLHKVNREHFKGWLVKDRDVSSGPAGDTRIGYYLDPQVSGFAYSGRQENWSQFDMALSRQNDCEVLATDNQVHNPNCGNSIDNFVDGESLEGHDPVMWFSIARQFLPKREDYPALLVRESRFTLMPFDWTSSTPFVEPEE